MEPDPDRLDAAMCAAAAAGCQPPRRGGSLDIDEHDRFDLITPVNAPFAYLAHAT